MPSQGESPSPTYIPVDRLGDTDSGWIERARSSRWGRCGLGLMVLSLSLGGFAALASVALVNILFGTLVLAALLTRAPFWQVPGFRLGLIFTAWCVLAAIVGAIAGEPTGRYHYFWGWLLLPLVWCAAQLATARRAALWGTAIALSLSAVVGVLQWTIGYSLNANVLHLDPEGTRFEQVSGITSYYVRYGPIAVFLATLLTLRQQQRWVQLGGLMAAGLGVILSMARMAILGANAAVLGALLLAYRDLKRSTMIIMLLVTLIPAGLAALLTPEKISRAINFQDGRMIIWDISADIIGEHPVFGLGSGRAFRDSYEARWPDKAAAWPTPLPIIEPSRSHAHNTLIGLATTSGIIAALLYLAWLARLFIAVRTAADPRTVFAGMMLLLAWLVVGLFEHLATTGAMTIAFALSLGVTLAVGRSQRPAS